MLKDGSTIIRSKSYESFISILHAQSLLFVAHYWIVCYKGCQEGNNKDHWKGHGNDFGQILYFYFLILHNAEVMYF